MRSTRFQIVIHGIAWGLLLLLLALGIPRVEKIVSDYDIPLPRLTILVIEASHLRTVVAALILFLAGTDLYVLETLSRRGNIEGARRWSAVMIATPLLLIVLVLAALVLPILTIDSGLSG